MGKIRWCKCNNLSSQLFCILMFLFSLTCHFNFLFWFTIEKTIYLYHLQLAFRRQAIVGFSSSFQEYDKPVVRTPIPGPRSQVQVQIFHHLFGLQNYYFLFILGTSIASHLILCESAISHNWPQIASNRTIWRKSHNSKKNAKFK